MLNLNAAASLFIVVALMASPSLRNASASPKPDIPVNGTLRAAIATAKPGDVLTLEPRAYSEGFIEITASGAPGAPITLRGVGVAQSILNGRLTFAAGVKHWVLADFTIDAAGQSSDAIRLGPGARHVAIRGMALRNSAGYGVHLEDGAQHIVIDSSEIRNFRKSGDAHGIGVRVASFVTITNNTITGNSGDGVQLHTNDVPGAGKYATDIVIASNHIFSNTENAIDIKSTRRVVIANNRLHSFRAADSDGEGIALQVQYDAGDVTIQGNVISNATMGIEVTRGGKNGTDYPAAPSNVRIVGNFLHDLPIEAGFTNAGNGAGIVLRGGSDVMVANNTVIRAGSSALYMGVDGSKQLTRGLNARNNVLHGGVNDLNYNSDFDTLGGPTFSHNHFVGGVVRGKALAQWASPLRDAQASSGDPLLDGNGLPMSDSPLIDTGMALGLPFAGGAPDRGWGEFAAQAPVPTAAPPAPTATLDPSLTVKLYLPVMRRR